MAAPATWIHRSEATLIRIDEPAAAERVLVLTPTGRDAEMLRDRIAAAGMSCEVCPDFQALLASISVGAAAVVIAQEALPQAGADGLLATLEAQEPWSDLPMLFLTEPRSKGPVLLSSFFERANATLLQRPLSIQDFMSSVRSAVRARHRQYEMRDLHRELERALQLNRLSEAKFAGIVSISADAIISIDESQRITVFNDGAEKTFGYSKEEIVGAPLDVLIPERFRRIHREHVERFAAGREVSRRIDERRAEIVGLRKSGEEFPADAAISRLEVGGERVLTAALRDMTEQRRTENAQRFLAELGSALASTLDYEEMPKVLATLLTREMADFCVVETVEERGTVHRLVVAHRDAGKAMVAHRLRMVELDRERPHLGSAVLETKQPLLMREVTTEYLESIAQNEEHRQALRELSPKSILALPLLTQGRPVGAMILISTTAARRYSEQDLPLAEKVAFRAALAVENARLYRTAQRAIQARDEVLGVVAHDLRNPLGTILMQAALFRHGGAEPERRSRRPAEAIERAATRMNRLIQDLLDVTRMEAGHLSVERGSVFAGPLVSDSIEAQMPLASQASLELVLDVPPDLPELWADRERLLQVFENLIGNAIKFSGPGGRITVGAAPRDREVLFWVADTGVGIAAEDLPHVFDRFWQARKPGRRGAGLGLAIVKGIVEAHGGRIWVQSTPGRGSTFFFTIPAAFPAEDWRHESA